MQNRQGHRTWQTNMLRTPRNMFGVLRKVEEDMDVLRGEV